MNRDFEERFEILRTLVAELRGRLGNLSERQAQDVGIWMLKACWLGEGKETAEIFSQETARTKPQLTVVT